MDSRKIQSRHNNPASRTSSAGELHDQMKQLQNMPRMQTPLKPTNVKDYSALEIHQSSPGHKSLSKVKSKALMSPERLFSKNGSSF